MKNKTILSIAIFAISPLIIPQMTFASWWKPNTWKIFNRKFEVKIERTIIATSTPNSAISQTEKATTTPTLSRSSGQSVGAEKIEQKSEDVKKNDQSKEIEKLKKELEALKRQQQSSVSNVSKQRQVESTKQVQTLVVTTKEENFRENIILMYARSAEDIKRFVKSTNIDIADLKDRRDRILNRVSLTKKTMYFTNLDHDTILFNQMIDLYVQEHEKEIKYINDNLEYIKSNTDFLDAYQAEYNRIILSFMANPQRVVMREELIKTMEYENDVSLERIYKAKKNIISALKNHYQSVIDNEDKYEKAGVILKDSLTKIGGTTSVSNSSYYQPMPQYDTGLTARQELLLNPIRCTIIHDPFQSFVTCY